MNGLFKPKLKPTGTNAYDFKISSVPATGTSGSVNTIISCTKLIAAYGFTESTLSWNSISPGTSGQYNNFLTNPQGTTPGTSGVAYNSQDTIIVTPQNGFTGPLVYQVCGNVPGNACNIVIPTGFTPNGDQINDTWDLIQLDLLYPNNKVFIYSRWGTLLFESEKGAYASNPWKGEYQNEPLPVASYYYIIDTGDDSPPVKGVVTIIK